MDEGYIKYNCQWQNRAIEIPEPIFNDLNYWRNRLYQLELIGVYDNGIGFGNLSYKHHEKHFYISGSSTGNKALLSMADYALVTQWDFKGNALSCIGETKASSESLTHAAVYESAKNAHAVVHIHSLPLWQKYLNNLPTTAADIAYGTPAMAYAIRDLIDANTNQTSGIIVMAGHKEGILSYAPSLIEASKLILDLYQSLNT